jgi:hypothetical protein
MAVLESGSYGSEVLAFARLQGLVNTTIAQNDNTAQIPYVDYHLDILLGLILATFFDAARPGTSHTS